MTEETLTKGSNILYDLHEAECKLRTVIDENPDVFWGALYQRTRNRKDFFEAIGEERTKRVEDLEKQIRDVFVEGLTQLIATLKQEFEAL